MSDAHDDAQSYALLAVAGVVALVVAGVLVLAVSRGGPRAPAAAPTPPAAAAATDLPRIYFEVDSDVLPAGAMEVLDRVADAARATPGAAVLISGYHDASGNPEYNADLAKRRAQAVRHALEANGVPPAQLTLDKPQQTAGGADAREARRVELRLQ
ncbi:OmpA family protein [uncultured Piscinibacter sp.]|uniref:OmpA family protein n=1 Tax=uncultured Piscinibacter sp. TaxID=1131835 RepID=UPI0026359318|nr:OmpA family protein [uncultured Piscinibacter sp.]